MKELIDKIGQLFMIGFPGKEPPAPFLNFIAEERIGGVILFEDNCPNYSQTKENIDSIKEQLKGNLPFIAIDQEGGKVSRLRGVPAEFKSPAVYGKDGDAEGLREDYGRSAVYMESLGINLNLAPVADIYLSEDSNWLKDRCYGNNPEIVAEFVRVSVQTAKSNSLLTCLKHFPGIGAATLDPHHDVPRVDYDQVLWEQRERVPFAAGIAEGADFVMTSHFLVPQFDDVIVTGSSKIITILRQNLSFDGPVITDDLSMEGASALGTIGERTIAAFNAGHDILLFGQDFDSASVAYDALVEAVERGELSKERLEAALDRIAGLKYNLVRTLSH